MKNKFRIDKFLAICFLIILVFFYFNNRSNKIQDINSNYTKNNEAVQELSISSLEKFYNFGISDDDFSKILYDSFPKEKIDLFNSIKEIHEVSSLTSEVELIKVNKIKPYRADKDLFYHYSAEIKINSFSENGNLIASEEKIFESYLVKIEEEFKILDMTLSNKN